MHRVTLLAMMLVSSVALDSSPQHRLGERGPDEAKNVSIEMSRALRIGLSALARHQHPVLRAEHCNIRVRRGKGDWALYFEPIPMGPGFDVMVVVTADGSATVSPGY